MKYKNSDRIIYTPLIIVISIIAGVFIGRFYKDNSMGKPSQFFIYPRTDKLNNVLNYIEAEYVDTVSKDKLIETTIPKLLSELDPHSVYIPARDFVAVNEDLEGNFSGIGVQFNMHSDTVVVINTIPNGPSEKVGILAGDRIVRVDGDTVAGVKMSSNKIVKKLKGPKGTHVLVGIKRSGFDEILEFDIKRDDIPLYSVDVAFEVEDSVGYIKISKFSSTTYEEFTKAFKELAAQNINYLLIDLRGNGGGYLSEVSQIADEFLPKNTLIVYTEGRSRSRQELRASANQMCMGITVGIIIDEASASASEILAGALQDNDRAVIIGRRSFGKGLVQEQTKLSDGSAVRLTTARYYTPSGRCIQKPYENGSDEYYNDINQRFIHGEFENVDSIKLNDSLKYYTADSNIVYGGGGIMPDFFIPFDTVGLSNYLSQIRNRGLIYAFAFNYTDKNREKLNSYQNLDELIEYLDTQDLVSQLIDFTDTKEVPRNNEDLKTSQKVIETQLKAYIARNIFDNKGFYPIIKEVDKTLNKAITIVKQYAK